MAKQEETVKVTPEANLLAVVQQLEKRVAALEGDKGATKPDPAAEHPTEDTHIMDAEGTMRVVKTRLGYAPTPLGIGEHFATEDEIAAYKKGAKHGSAH